MSKEKNSSAAFLPLINPSYFSRLLFSLVIGIAVTLIVADLVRPLTLLPELFGITAVFSGIYNGLIMVATRVAELLIDVASIYIVVVFGHEATKIVKVVIEYLGTGLKIINERKGQENEST